MTWELADRNLIRGFLKLENLLINKLALLVDHKVRVYRAWSPWFPQRFLPTAYARQRYTSKSSGNWQNLEV
jgi:hypothetical protein